MGGQPESAHATEELLERYVRLSLERDELAVKVAELKRELDSHAPADAPPSRRRIALLWLAVALASTITLGVVGASAAILAGFWDPLGSNATPTSLAVPGLPPPLVQPSSAEPQPAPAPPRAQSPSPPAAVPRLPETPPPARAQTELEIVAARGDSWLQVRRGSASGPVVYEGILERGRSVSFADRRLWLRFAVGDHLDVTVDGKRVTGLSSLAGNAVVRPERVRVLGVG